LCSGVLGFPSLPLGDGAQQQDRPRWDVGISRSSALPLIGPITGAVCRVNTSLFKELPNEFAAFISVVVEGFVGPLPGDEHAPPGDAEVLGLVSLALTPPGSHRIPGAFGLDTVE
jgi:hypothetical protein